MFNAIPFLSTEKKAIFSIAGIFALRMMGLFLILPIFRDYAAELKGQTPAWIGIAVGIYGLTQACFQIPFGFWSDRFGRRPVILFGLGLFLLGSMISAVSTQIQGLAIGRALQGMGAIGAVLTASLTDFTREVLRPRAMAWLGMSIGISFVGAMIFGPILNLWFSVPHLFWGMSAASVLAMMVAWQVWSEIECSKENRLTFWITLQAKTLRHHSFLSALVGVFGIHAGLTLIFLFLPNWLRSAGLEQDRWWQFYLPIFMLGFSGTMKVIKQTEKTNQLGFCLSMAALGFTLVSLGLILFHEIFVVLCLLMTLFFMAFSLLEAGLPAWVAKQVPSPIKGTALGIYASAQFLGIFGGGVLGGWLMGFSR